MALPGAKATLYDRGLGVMLIMRGPGGFSGGKVIDAMVTHLDVFPTLCDLAGVDRPPWLQGSESGRGAGPLTLDERKRHGSPRPWPGRTQRHCADHARFARTEDDRLPSRAEAMLMSVVPTAALAACSGSGALASASNVSMSAARSSR